MKEETLGKVIELLEGGVDLPDVRGDFHITIDGVPLCKVETALIGRPDSECNFESLNDSFIERMKLRSVFPAASVMVHAGKCPCEDEQKAA